MENVLSVNNLKFNYGPSEVLKGVSFDVKKGEYVALAGPNGAGKTTLIKVILGLEKKYKGKIKLFGNAGEKFSTWRRVGYLPQRVNTYNPLFPATVKEVAGLGLLSCMKNPKRFNRKFDNRIDETLKLLGIFNLRDKSISALSGGEQQKVFLARAIISEPELIILDEPTTALDPKTRDDFFDLISKLNKEKNVTVILITHDTSDIGKYAKKLLYLDKEVIFYGLFSEFCKAKNMEKYFGHFFQHIICHQHI